MTVYRAADMAKWTAKAKMNQMWVVKKSIEEVSKIAQTPKAKGGRMPVDKSFLRNSFTSGLNGSTSLTGPDVYVATIAGLDLGDIFSAGWTMEYARRVHSGFVGTDSRGRKYNQSGAYFMAEALMQWQAINDRNAAKLKD